MADRTEGARRDWCEEHNRGSLAETDGICPDCERVTQRIAERNAATVNRPEGAGRDVHERLAAEWRKAREAELTACQASLSDAECVHPKCPNGGMRDIPQACPLPWLRMTQYHEREA